MVKFNASVSLALLQLALFSRTSVSLPVPSGQGLGDQPMYPGDLSSANPGKDLKLLAVGAAATAAGTAVIYCTAKIVDHCIPRKPQEPDLEAHRPGSHPPNQGESTAGHASGHVHRPDEKTPLLGSPAGAKHIQEHSKETENHHGSPVHQRDLM